VDPLWLLLPAGQRRSGEWIDDTLARRVAERGMEAKWPLAANFPRQRVEVIRAADPDASDLHAEVNDLFYKRGWTDGLPIMPPTLGKVEAAVRASGRSPRDALGEMEPLGGIATVEKIAANAVMAGAAPAHMPVILAAVDAILDPAFNLRGIQTTDENAAPLLIVNGPAASALDINDSYGALGPGWRANACIGRAIRLVMNNIGGGWPAVVSFAGLGYPGRYTLCFAEKATANPWEPFHVEAGFDAGQSTVTVLRAETMINVTGGLEELASVMASAASSFTMLYEGKVAVVIAPSVAAKLHKDGWTKADVKAWLWEHARMPVEVWRRSRLCTDNAEHRDWPDWVLTAAKGDSIPVLRDPEDITLVVAGGDIPIPQCAYFPSWGFPPCCVTREIAWTDGPASEA
jgi:hypothetical protein